MVERASEKKRIILTAPAAIAVGAAVSREHLNHLDSELFGFKVAASLPASSAIVALCYCCCGCC